MASINASDSDFEEAVLKAEGPVVVDFWAEWCGPCKAMAPVIDEVAAEMDGRLTFVKMNIEDAPVTPTQYGVRGIPTLMFFRDGQVVDTRVGGMSRDQLVRWIEQYL